MDRLSLLALSCSSILGGSEATISGALGLGKMEVLSMSDSLCSVSTVICGSGESGDLTSMTPKGRFLY